MSLKYTPPTWMSWEDKGGSLFGNKDANEALRRGVNPTLVAEAMRQSDARASELGIVGRGGHNESGYTEGGQKLSTAANIEAAYESARGGTLDSSLGQSGHTGGVDMNIFAHGAAAGGKSMGQIGQAITKQGNFNPDFANTAATSLGQQQGFWAQQGSAQDAADTAAADAAANAAWRQQESDRRTAEAERRYNQMVKAQEDAAEAARKEALKVKHTGATHVGQGQSAMGIKFAQSPAFASGAASRGTAQLARSDKGTKLTNMNIA